MRPRAARPISTPARVGLLLLDAVLRRRTRAVPQPPVGIAVGVLVDEIGSEVAPRDVAEDRVVLRRRALLGIDLEQEAIAEAADRAVAEKQVAISADADSCLVVGGPIVDGTVADQRVVLRLRLDPKALVRVPDGKVVDEAVIAAVDPEPTPLKWFARLSRR